MKIYGLAAFAALWTISASAAPCSSLPGNTSIAAIEGKNCVLRGVVTRPIDLKTYATNCYGYGCDFFIVGNKQYTLQNLPSVTADQDYAYAFVWSYNGENVVLPVGTTIDFVNVEHYGHSLIGQIPGTTYAFHYYEYTGPTPTLNANPTIDTYKKILSGFMTMSLVDPTTP